MNSAYPQYVGNRTGGGAPAPPPVQPYPLTAIVVGTALVASYMVPSQTRLIRAFVQGPGGSTCRLYIGNLQPAQLILDRRYLVDYTLTGSSDYASYDPPLEITSGWFLAYAWTGAPLTSGAFARVELQVL